MPNDTNEADPLDSEYRNQFSRVSHLNKKKNPKLGEIQADPSTGSSSSKTKTASFDSTTTDNTLVAAANLTTPAHHCEKNNGNKSSTIKCLPVSHDLSSNKEDQVMEIPISVKNSSDPVGSSSITAEKTS